MAGIGKSKKQAGFLLLMLMGLGLACLALPESAECGAAPAWIKRYHVSDIWGFHSAMALDGQGNVYVTGGAKGSQTGFDYLTIKYSPGGKQLWAQRYNGPVNGDDASTGLAVDSKGNVYVTGWSRGGRNRWDLATVKYRADGRRLWVRRYLSGGEAKGIAMDAEDNIYVTGERVTIKYDPDGRQIWVRPFDAPNSHPVALAVDGQGNAYLHGSLTNPGSSLPTLKYSPDGLLLWMTGCQFHGDLPSEFWYSTIALDTQGNAYVSGGTVFGRGFLTIKYSPEGQQLWERWEDLEGNYSPPSAVAVDGQGNVYVAGTVASYGDPRSHYSNYITIKYSPDGQTLWIQEGFSDSYASALTLDGQGNVYITGSSTIKYNPEGQILWEQMSNFGAWPRAIALDAQGSVYVTGLSWDYASYTAQDFVTVKYIQTPRTGR
jgi:sugar lactone lactonase YvrE